MSKRFLNTELHNNPWYMGLEPKYKALWHHMLEECNHAGIWQVNFQSAAFFVKAKLDPARCKEVMKGHIVEIHNGKFWFIPGFIDFQYGKDLNPNNNVHKSVLELLKEFKIQNKNVGLTSPSKGAKDKEKDKAKVKDNVLKSSSSSKNLKSEKSKNSKSQEKSSKFQVPGSKLKTKPVTKIKPNVSKPAPGIGQASARQHENQEQALPHVHTSTLPHDTTPALPHPLFVWVKQNTPRVNQLKKPLTEAECDRLLNDFSERKVKNTLLDMENYQKLLTSYTSANLTVRKWLRLQEEREEGKPKRYKPEVDDTQDFTYWEPGKEPEGYGNIDVSNLI